MISCQYCNQPAQLLRGSELHRGRDDLSEQFFWVCRPCDAWVGCHPRSDRPLGTLAQLSLRRWRSRAHELFDPLWRREPKKRSQRYRWLADRLGIHPDQCHIGMFTIEQCKKVVEICKQASPLGKQRLSLVEQIEQKRLTTEFDSSTNAPVVVE